VKGSFQEACKSCNKQLGMFVQASSQVLTFGSQNEILGEQDFCFYDICLKHCLALNRDVPIYHYQNLRQTASVLSLISHSIC